MRTIKEFSPERLAELEKALDEVTDPKDRNRLLALKAVATGKLTSQEVATIHRVTRKTIFNWILLFRNGGVEELLRRRYTHRQPGIDGETLDKLKVELGNGTFRRLKDVQQWLGQLDVEMTVGNVGRWVKRLGGKLKVPRKSHVLKDEAKVKEFRDHLADKLRELAPDPSRTRIWVADEHRHGLLPVVRRTWGLEGKRIYAPYKTVYQWMYVYEALEVGGTSQCEFLYCPTVDKGMSLAFLGQISRSDPGSTHVVIWDGAGFHPLQVDESVPGNVKLLRLPPYSPELNPVENLGSRVKDKICNQIFESIEQLQDKITEALEPLFDGAKEVEGLIHDWLSVKVNSTNLEIIKCNTI